MVDYSLQDLLNSHHKKINELINSDSKQEELITYLKDNGIKEEVIKQLQIYINNNNFNMDGGTF